MNKLNLFLLLLVHVSTNTYAQDQGEWKIIPGNGTGVVCIHTAMLPGPIPWGSKWKLWCAERP
ncbi:hypothetical protein HK096_010980, partial [Nowakowskiella sp. JEL0078]